MQATRNKNAYVVAGTPYIPSQPINVRENVHVPGGEADAVRGDSFFARDAGMSQSRKKRRGIPAGTAVLILSLVLILFICIIAGKLIYQSNVNKDIGNTWSRVSSMASEISHYESEIAEKQSKTSICYRAVQELGMINGDSAESVYITVSTNTANNTLVELPLNAAEIGMAY